jgi:hypothetical protein
MVGELRAFLDHYDRAVTILDGLVLQEMSPGEDRVAWLKLWPNPDIHGYWNGLYNLLLHLHADGPPRLIISARYLGPPFSDPGAFASALREATHFHGLDPLLAPVRRLLDEVLDAIPGKGDDEAEPDAEYGPIQLFGPNHPALVRGDPKDFRSPEEHKVIDLLVRAAPKRIKCEEIEEKVPSAGRILKRLRNDPVWGSVISRPRPRERVGYGIEAT